VTNFSKSIKVLFLILAILLPIAVGRAASEDKIVVVVHKENLNTVDLAFVAKIYSGSVRFWPDGSAVVALDQLEDSEARAVFTALVLNRTVANMRAIWAQNIFTGKGLPPKIIPSELDTKKLVANNRNAIAYVHASQVDASLRVIEK
jgi:ABC-type phosphate transport system substrate-binding protein